MFLYQFSVVVTQSTTLLTSWWLQLLDSLFFLLLCLPLILTTRSSFFFFSFGAYLVLVFRNAFCWASCKQGNYKKKKVVIICSL